MHALFLSIIELLERHGVSKELPGNSEEYVTGARWTPAARADSVGGLADEGRPSSADVRRYMQTVGVDWSQPLYPSKPGFRYHHDGPLEDEEWAQMEYGEMLTDQAQLVDNTKVAYNSQCLKADEFLRRWPTAQTFSNEHAKTGIKFDPAVWKGTEVQRVLCDLAMHDAYVRGNSWSSVHQMLYAIRHLNVKHFGYDILKNKPRLWQLMDGLKKCKGKKQAKSPVTHAMLLAMERMLPHKTDEDALRMWAAVLTAFHFMLRSMDYCAKLEYGRFDLDNVLRIRDVTFKKNGKRMHSRFSEADEVILVLGRGKTTGGGEIRGHSRSSESRLCVVQVLGRMFETLDRSQPDRPLFAWKADSRKAGEGVRYTDVMNLLKQAAEVCGRDTKEFGTHSLRRGGASCYLLAGKLLDEVALFGRWADTRSMRSYVEPSAGFMMRGAQDKVNRGEEEPNCVLRRPQRARAVQMRRAARKVAEDIAAA